MIIIIIIITIIIIIITIITNISKAPFLAARAHIALYNYVFIIIQSIQVP